MTAPFAPRFGRRPSDPDELARRPRLAQFLRTGYLATVPAIRRPTGAATCSRS
ncbi:hypothetical protein [Pseudonocardia spinosispora]|uniref:hypothetical protein n=1 Tax=Pseudonocardia spinosispora TaxID=103441 RepID=UPI000420F05C|nr:hypothetical protein [Pseudonocardia spinosispora]